ncbi:MAG: tetratricopeptide repeat protein [Xenococcus sp. (in: cyanobacteria)]
MNKKLLQRILVVVFGLAFVGSTGAVIVGSLLRREPTVANNPVAETANPLEQLQAQAKGYEKVLSREPDNVNALSALIQIRLQTGDLEGAIAPLDKLVAIYPEEQSLITLQQQIKQELENRSNESEATTSEVEN